MGRGRGLMGGQIGSVKPRSGNPRRHVSIRRLPSGQDSHHGRIRAHREVASRTVFRDCPKLPPRWRRFSLRRSPPNIRTPRPKRLGKAGSQAEQSRRDCFPARAGSSVSRRNRSGDEAWGKARCCVERCCPAQPRIAQCCARPRDCLDDPRPTKPFSGICPSTSRSGSTSSVSTQGLIPSSRKESYGIQRILS